MVLLENRMPKNCSTLFSSLLMKTSQSVIIIHQSTYYRYLYMIVLTY
jgi:hypothetical protein